MLETINEDIEEIKIILKPEESIYIPIVANWDEETFKENNVKYEATSTFEINW